MAALSGVNLPAPAGYNHVANFAGLLDTCILAILAPLGKKGVCPTRWRGSQSCMNMVGTVHYMTAPQHVGKLRRQPCLFRSIQASFIVAALCHRLEKTFKNQ